MHVRVASCKLRGEVFWNGQGFGRHFWPWCLPLVLVALGSLHDFNWSLQSQPSCCGTQLRQRRSAWKERGAQWSDWQWQCFGTSGVEICRNCLMMIRMQQKDVRIFWNVSILRVKPPIQLCFLNAKSIGLGCLEGNEVNDQCKRPCKKPGLQWIISLRLDVLKPLLNVYQLLFLARACTWGLHLSKRGAPQRLSEVEYTFLKSECKVHFLYWLLSIIVAGHLFLFARCFWRNFPRPACQHGQTSPTDSDQIPATWGNMTCMVERAIARIATHGTWKRIESFSNLDLAKSRMYTILAGC